MKRHGNLFNRIFTPENLQQAFLDARRGKRKKWACFHFETNLGHNLAALHREIHDGTYRPRPYFKFKVYEPKERIIHAPAFRDIVVQHAIYRVIYPLFNATFIDQSFACRVGMGTHRASDYTQRALNRVVARRTAGRRRSWTGRKTRHGGRSGLKRESHVLQPWECQALRPLRGRFRAYRPDP